MFVALHGDHVVGTCAHRLGGPSSPLYPAWLAERYADRDTVAQVLRLAVLPQHRRNGLTRAHIHAVWDFARADAATGTLCLHINARVTGAEEFWRSLLVQEICDTRSGTDTEPDRRFLTIHFELPLS